MEISHCMPCSRVDSDSNGGGSGVAVTVADSFTLFGGKKYFKQYNNE